MNVSILSSPMSNVVESIFVVKSFCDLLALVQPFAICQHAVMCRRGNAFLNHVRYWRNGASASIVSPRMKVLSVAVARSSIGQ